VYLRGLRQPVRGSPCPTFDWLRGDAYDNAMAESFFASLECELLDRRCFRSQAEARVAVFRQIEGWYNPRRRHSARGFWSPVNFEAKHRPPVSWLAVATAGYDSHPSLTDTADFCSAAPRTLLTPSGEGRELITEPQPLPVRGTPTPRPSIMLGTQATSPRPEGRGLALRFASRNSLSRPTTAVAPAR